METSRFLVNVEWRESENTGVVVNPYTGRPAGQVYQASAAIERRKEEFAGPITVETGNSVVLKPSSKCVTGSLLLAGSWSHVVFPLAP